VLGDLDPNGGPSDINAAVHRWNNPVAVINVTMIGDDGPANGPSAVVDLIGEVYSSTALEIFWQAATSTDSVVLDYEIVRDGELISTIGGLSFFESELLPGVNYVYEVRAIDVNGNAGAFERIELRTNEN